MADGALRLHSRAMADSVDPELYAAAVGRRQTFYVAYFQRADARGYAPLSWNWAMFLLGVFWLLYRRQYHWAGLLLLAVMGISIVAVQIAAAGYKGMADFFSLATAIAVNAIYALKANGFYYRWVRRCADGAKAGFALDRERQRQTLAARCGPNIHAPLILAALIVLMMLAMPPGSA